MNQTSEIAPVVVPPGAGPHYYAFGDEIIVHLSGEQTGGKFTLFTDITPPGGGPPLHFHLNEDEWFVVLDGRVSFYLEGKWQEPLTAGHLVFAPRGVVHTFKNVGDGPLKLLVTASPSGFETFFRRCHDEFEAPGGPDMERILAIAADHGIQFPKT
jgi:mannose-6-phosphate isomerase-like protein (cupin superfamily)